MYKKEFGLLESTLFKNYLLDAFRNGEEVHELHTQRPPKWRKNIGLYTDLFQNREKLHT